MAEELDAGLSARDAERVAAAFAKLPADRPLDARRTVCVANLCAQMRHNAVAWRAFEAGRAVHGVPKLVAAGLSLNGLLYACCREPAMLGHATSLWALLGESGVKPDGQPTEKLVLANLAQHKYDEAFGVFLDAIDAGLQLGGAACTALVRTCAVQPRLAQSAFAVYLTMKEAGTALSADVLGMLLSACLEEGTAEQCVALQAELDHQRVPANGSQLNLLAVKCAAEGSAAYTAKAATILTKLRAEGATSGQSTISTATYAAVFAALSRAALSRSSPSAVETAHSLLEEMSAATITAEPPALRSLLAASCRTGQRAAALASFRSLVACGEPLEPAMLRSAALTLGSAPTSSSPLLDVPAADVDRLLLLMADQRPDKEVAAATVRLCAAAGMLGEARQRLGGMCAARNPPMPPGGALLATFVNACAQHASGPEEGVTAFEELGGDGPLSVSKHGEIWAALVRSCSTQHRADLGFRLLEMMRTRGLVIDDLAAIDLLSALEDQNHASQAFELRTLLEHRGIALPAARSMPTMPPTVPPAGPHLVPALPREDEEEVPTSQPRSHPPTLLSAASGSTAASTSAAAPASAASAASSSVPAAAFSASGGSEDLDVAGRHAALVRMIGSSVAEGRLTQAIDLVRRACALGSAPADETLRSLLDALFAGKQMDGAIALYHVLQHPPSAHGLSEAEGGGGEAGGTAGGEFGEGGGGGGISRSLTLHVLDGVVDDPKGGSAHAVRAMNIFNELRADVASGSAAGGEAESGASDSVPLDTCRKLLKLCVAAGMISDAYDVLTHAQQLVDDMAAAAAATARAERGGRAAAGKRTMSARGGGRGGGGGGGGGSGAAILRRMQTDVIAAFVKQQQLPRAYSLFRRLAASGAPPAASLCATLLDALCSRGMGLEAAAVLTAMHGASMPLDAKLCCQVIAALLRSGQRSRAFAIFEAHLEHTGSAESSVGSLHSPEWNVEHVLARLTKSLAQAMEGMQAHRVYAAARSSGLCTNYSLYALPALTLACVEGGMISQAMAVCDDARQALLPLDSLTASALLTGVSKKRMTSEVCALLVEVSARRLSCDAPSLLAAFNYLLQLAPPPLDDVVRAITLLAAACKAAALPSSAKAAAAPADGRGGGRGGGGRGRGRGGGGRCSAERLAALEEEAAKGARRELPGLLHAACEELCQRGEEPKAVRLIRTMRTSGVLPETRTIIAIANACARRQASYALSELTSTLLFLRPSIGAAAYDEAAIACVAAGAPEGILLGPASDPPPSEAAPSLDPTEGRDREGPAPFRRISSGAADAKAERAALTAVQTISLQREREELRIRTGQLMKLLGRRTRTLEYLRQELPSDQIHLLEAAEEKEKEEEEEEVEEEEEAGEGGEGGRADAFPSASGAARSDGFDSLAELQCRYTEMARVARERQGSLHALQRRHAEVESRNRTLTRLLREAGVTGGAADDEDRRTGELDVALFADSTSKFRPPDGWPDEVEYTNQLQWDEVPTSQQFLRERIADPSSVRRKWRLKVVLIKSKKHPCCGERGLYAAEDIPAGEALVDYAGKISVVVGEAHDTNKSSYLLNIFSHEDPEHEEAAAYIDIDASRCGNESRFVNDFHGTGLQPNSQFWPYFDSSTGEKRMAVKTTRPLISGEEILVDYGGRYFERDSSEDSDMHSSDDEFAGQKTRARGPPAKKKRKLV